MEEQKILFADLYSLTDSLKDEVKGLGKKIELVLMNSDWTQITMIVNGLVAESEIIARLAANLDECCDRFLHGGPYAGQGAGQLPLEGMVEE